MLARGLASGRTYTVGLVVPDLVHPFFAEFAKSLGGVLRSSNRALLLASSEEDPEVERQEIRTLLSRGVDVLLIASCQPNLRNFYELFRHILRAFVLNIGCQNRQPDCVRRLLWLRLRQ